MRRWDDVPVTEAASQVAAEKTRRRPWFRRGDTENLARWQLFAFALPTIPLAVLLLPAAVLLPPFYTGELGLSLTTWALLILVARIWDIITDPFVGILSDRLPSRWGRRRHLLVMSAPLVMIGCAMLFMPTLFIHHVTSVYVLVAMLVLNMGATVTGLNSAAWGAELSADYHERTRIMGWRGAVSSVAPIVAFGIPAAMEWLHHGVTTAEKIAVLGWVALFLLPATLAAAIFSVGEKPHPPVEEHDDGPGLWLSLKLLITNPLMLRMMAALTLAAIPSSVMLSLFVFYVSYVLRRPDIASSLLVIALFAAMVSLPFWMWVAKGREKHRVVATALVLMGMIQFGYLFLGPGDVLAFCIILFGVGFSGTGASGFLMQSIMVDIVDSDTEVSGRERTGAFFAILETITKLAPTLALTIVFPLLQFMGFDPTGKHNSASSINAIKYCYALAPTIPALLGCWIMWGFPLGSKEQAELRARIESKRTAPEAS